MTTTHEINKSKVESIIDTLTLGNTEPQRIAMIIDTLQDFDQETSLKYIIEAQNKFVLQNINYAFKLDIIKKGLRILWFVYKYISAGDL